MLQNFIIILLLSLVGCSGAPSYLYKGMEREPLTEIEPSFKPHGGFIRKPDSAAKIAEIIGKEFYGDDVIENQKPLLVTKAGAIWIVRGTFPEEDNLKGGVFEIRISSDNGTILGMIHGE